MVSQSLQLFLPSLPLCAACPHGNTILHTFNNGIALNANASQSNLRSGAFNRGFQQNFEGPAKKIPDLQRSGLGLCVHVKTGLNDSSSYFLMFNHS